MQDLLNSQDALKFISECMKNNLRIGTVDGFRIVPAGYMEDLDLMYSPTSDQSNAMTCENASRFINQNQEQDIVWEIWTEEAIGRGLDA